jgi:hypothetical protein
VRLVFQPAQVQCDSLGTIAHHGESTPIRLQDGAKAAVDGCEIRHPQYAASVRIASWIRSGLTMNQSSSTWLYGTAGTSGPATRVTGPSR